MTPQSTTVHAARLRRKLDDAPRLRLCLDSEASGYIDATWWPRSSDLAIEFPDLTTAVRSRAGPIWRIVYVRYRRRPRNETTDRTCRVMTAGEPNLGPGRRATAGSDRC